MPDLNSLLIFAKVVEANSFSEAARRLNMPISTVSRRIAELEDRLGIRLLERSTRSLRLTDLGTEVLEHARRAIDLNEALEGIISNRASKISGVIRLSAPPSISDTLLTPIICAFQTAHPDVRVQVLVTDRWVDHVSEGVDLVFRVGVLKDSSLVARKMLTFRHQLVASPAYLATCTPPTSPQDLQDHKLIAFAHWKPDNSWTFVQAAGKGGETVNFVPRLAMNDYAGLASALLHGGGIGDLPPVVQPALLREGLLVEVMPEWRFRTFDLSVVHLGGRHVTHSVRAFKEFAAQMAPRLYPDLPV